jgi:hypothetical protein
MNKRINFKKLPNPLIFLLPFFFGGSLSYGMEEQPMGDEEKGIISYSIQSLPKEIMDDIVSS